MSSCLLCLIHLFLLIFADRSILHRKLSKPQQLKFNRIYNNHGAKADELNSTAIVGMHGFSSDNDMDSPVMYETRLKQRINKKGFCDKLQAQHSNSIAFNEYHWSKTCTWPSDNIDNPTVNTTPPTPALGEGGWGRLGPTTF